MGNYEIINRICGDGPDNYAAGRRYLLSAFFGYINKGTLDDKSLGLIVEHLEKTFNNLTLYDGNINAYFDGFFVENDNDAAMRCYEKYKEITCGNKTMGLFTALSLNEKIKNYLSGN